MEDIRVLVVRRLRAVGQRVDLEPQLAEWGSYVVGHVDDPAVAMRAVRLFGGEHDLSPRSIGKALLGVHLGVLPAAGEVIELGDLATLHVFEVDDLQATHLVRGTDGRERSYDSGRVADFGSVIP